LEDLDKEVKINNAWEKIGENKRRIQMKLMLIIRSMQDAKSADFSGIKRKTI
jgi:hypothetical protein